MPKGSPRPAIRGAEDLGRAFSPNENYHHAVHADAHSGHRPSKFEASHSNGSAREVMELSPREDMEQTPRDSEGQEPGPRGGNAHGVSRRGELARLSVHDLPHAKGGKSVLLQGAVLSGLQQKMRETEAEVEALQERILQSLSRPRSSLDTDAIAKANESVAMLIKIRDQIAVAIQHQQQLAGGEGQSPSQARRNASPPQPSHHHPSLLPNLPKRGYGYGPRIGGDGSFKAKKGGGIALPAVRRGPSGGVGGLGNARYREPDPRYREPDSPGEPAAMMMMRDNVGHVPALAQFEGQGQEVLRDPRMPAGSRAFVQRQRRAREIAARDPNLKDANLEIRYRIGGKGGAGELLRRDRERSFQQQHSVEHRVIRNQVAMERKWEMKKQESSMWTAPPPRLYRGGWG